MNPEDDSPLEQVLRRLSDKLRGEFLPTLELTQRIKAAVDAYARAVEGDLAVQLARKHGLDVPEVPQALQAARALADLIKGIPELALAGTAADTAVEPAPLSPPAAPTTPSAPAAISPGTPVVIPPDPVPQPKTGILAPSAVLAVPPEPQPVSSVFTTTPTTSRVASPDALDLITKFKTVSFEEMSDELFHAYAQEYAARARELQDKAIAEGTGTDELGFVIRKLTAMVHERGLEGVYGLSRRHVGPWTDRITRAKVQRERIEARSSTPRNGATAAAKPLRAVAPATGGTPATARDDDDAGDEEGLELPHIQDLAKRSEIVIIGGVAKQEKVSWLSRVGVEVSWVPADGHGFLDALARRITEGRVGALIVLEQLVYHHQLDPLLEAARRVRLPLAYAGKGGKGSLRRALQELDTMQQQRGDTPPVNPVKSSG